MIHTHIRLTERDGFVIQLSSFFSIKPPFSQIQPLFNLTATRTSLVPIAFWENFLISLMALGAFFLNVHPWRRSWRLMVYSLVTISSFLPVPVFSTIFTYDAGSDPYTVKVRRVADGFFDSGTG
ncbi:unnamed protein product [Vicia faba]|uniref:Uncharacterized protein n=1 Tax=Vicia faba TaxID=3906 RepID=A0AAV0YT20_VICFA|nr:unnamed protein product [Vicia faba]